jgi:hypothetical protein
LREQHEEAVKAFVKMGILLGFEELYSKIWVMSETPAKYKVLCSYM